MAYSIREINVSELNLAVEVLNHLPEFDSIFYIAQLQKRLSKPESILLLAESNGKPVGCKLAYNRNYDGSVYSWLGGVLPEYRNSGIATALLNKLEQEARRKFFLSVRMKTRNKHIAMLCFSLKNGFQINGFQVNEDRKESRIELIKML